MSDKPKNILSNRDLKDLENCTFIKTIGENSLGDPFIDVFKNNTTGQLVYKRVGKRITGEFETFEEILNHVKSFRSHRFKDF